MEQGGLNTEYDYPYQNQDNGNNCLFDASKPTYDGNFTKIKRLQSGDETEMLHVLANYGPISAGIHVVYVFMCSLLICTFFLQFYMKYMP
jgi:hypothetical protein